MELIYRLPEDIQLGMFRFFSHPVAAAFRCEEARRMVEKIRNYYATLEVLNSFSQDHCGEFGRATLLNHLWLWAHDKTGGWYKIWERRADINDEWGAKLEVSRIAARPHTYQINMLWALFSEEERDGFLAKN